MLNINLTESEFVAYMDFRGSIKNYKNTWVMILSIVRESSSGWTDDATKAISRTFNSKTFPGHKILVIANVDTLIRQLFSINYKLNQKRSAMVLQCL